MRKNIVFFEIVNNGTETVQFHDVLYKTFDVIFILHL